MMSDSRIRFSFSALKLLFTLKYIDTLTARFRQNAHGNAGLISGELLSDVLHQIDNRPLTYLSADVIINESPDGIQGCQVVGLSLLIYNSSFERQP